MKKILSLLLVSLISSHFLFAQTQTADIYRVKPNGSIRFWSSSDYYQIQMGNNSTFRYGPVQDYSIKTTMYRSSSTPNRGWTWGELNKTPVIAMRTDGTMQIAKDFYSLGKVGIGTTSPGSYNLNVNGYANVEKGLRIACNGCGSQSSLFGSYNWGTLTIQGRVFSTNENLHLSPPGGKVVKITDNYRAAGGTSSGTAGLYVSGQTQLSVDGGNTGIGLASTPSEKLDVNGTVRVRSLPSGSSNNVVVADSNGKLHIRDASTIGGTGTDNQDLTLSGNILSLTNDASTVNLSSFLDNTDAQTLSLSGNDLTILGGNTIDISSIDTDTNTQLSEAEVDAFVVNNGYLTTEVDGDATNEIQDLQLTGDILTITNHTGPAQINLADYLDNTDTQLSESEVDAYVANNGYLTTQSDDQTAAEVNYDNATSGLTATDTQGALDEVTAMINAKDGSRWTETNGNISYTDSVSIGTTDVAKGYLLSVAGNAIMEEVNVKLKIEWPDYVFEDSYELQSLEATENYISENKHLPNVPSAQEVEKEGINLGEMNAALLRKVEELTLHLIDQNKKIETLLERVDELEAGN